MNLDSVAKNASRILYISLSWGVAVARLARMDSLEDVRIMEPAEATGVTN